MKRIAFALAALLPVSILAGMTAVSFNIPVASTNATASTLTRYNVSGQLLEVSVSTTSTSSVQIVTTAGYGSSLGAAKTLYTMTTVAGNALSATSTNTPGIYLYNDMVTMSVTGALTATESVSGILILDTK